MFGFGMEQTQRLAQRQEQRLTQEQRLVVEQRLLGSRLAMLSALSDERFENHTTCPECGHNLTLVEVMKGFRQDPADITTECPRCKNRFYAKLRSPMIAGYLEVYLYCPAQTQSYLRGLIHLSPEGIRKENASVYFSAKFHYGSLTNAFAQEGISYPFPEVISWKDKIKPFLGKLPDKIIAEAVNQKPGKITALRNELKIPRYTKRGSLS